MTNIVSFEDFLTEWLEEIKENNPHSLELGRRFSHKLLTQWRDIDSSSTDVVYCDGSEVGWVER
jgi:hypothetical protein